MTNDADYELWAAMMADDEPVAPVTPVVSVPVAEPTPVVPEVVVSEPPVFAPPMPDVEEVPLVPQVDEIEEDHLPLSDLAQATIAEVSAPASVFTPAVEDPDSDEELDFPTNLFKEPQTNSITIPEVPDALNTDIVTETGEVLKTGAIDIPLMNNTGSIPIITVVPESIDEEAIKADMGDETTGGIPPIRARSVMNSSARVGVLPIKNRRSEGQVILLATTSILLVTLGAGVLALYMLEIIK